MQAPQGGGGSDDSARGGDMSGCPSQLLWRKLTTTLRRRWELCRPTLHGARRPVQLEAATVGYVAASTPLLVVASLAGGDEVDATTTR